MGTSKFNAGGGMDMLWFKFIVGFKLIFSNQFIFLRKKQL